MRKLRRLTGVSGADTHARGVEWWIGAQPRPRTVALVAKTKTRTSGRVGNRFWKLLGASTERDQARSMAQVQRLRGVRREGRRPRRRAVAEGRATAQPRRTSPNRTTFRSSSRSPARPPNAPPALRPFDVQLLGALRMLAGDVVEMATGEGKTLSGAIAAAGLRARRAGTCTSSPINDYLARRDAEWMGPLLEAHGADRRLGHRGLDRRRAPRRLRVRRHLRARSTRSASTCCATSWSPTSTTWCRRTPTWR